MSIMISPKIIYQTKTKKTKKQQKKKQQQQQQQQKKDNKTKRNAYSRIFLFFAIRSNIQLFHLYISVA